MTFCSTLIQALLLVTAIQLLVVRDAQAYLDPGTASFFFQMVVASILGALLALKVYWQKVKAGAKSLFSSTKKKDDA